MRRASLLSFIGISLMSAACGPRENATSDTAVRAATPTRLGETGGMKTPESVRYDADLDVYYVSNIDGNSSQKDGKGSILVVRADSTGTSRVLVEGGQAGATLNAPKGLALRGDTLWVADIDAVRAFDRKTGAPLASVELRAQGATFLNDVAVGPDGAVYVTDTGIRFDEKGEMSHPGTDRIFRVSGGRATLVAKGDSLAAPNGIAWDATAGRWVLGPFNSPNVQTWKEGDAAPATLAIGPGGYDGVEVLADGRVLVTSWTDSAVHVIRGSEISVLVPNVTAPADIGVDTKRNVLAIPRFNDNKVEYYSIP